jgi:hypothetical protein
LGTLSAIINKPQWLMAIKKPEIWVDCQFLKPQFSLRVPVSYQISSGWLSYKKVSRLRIVIPAANFKSPPAKLVKVNATVFIVFLQCLLCNNSKNYPVLVCPVIFPFSVWV